MEKNIFQEIQDAYSLLTKLLIVLVDCNGNLITNYSFSGSFHFPSHFLNVFQDRLKEIVPKYKHLQKSIIFDLFPGFKVYMIPFQAFSEKLSFIISGFFLEEGTRQQVLQYIEKHEPFYDPNLLINIPEFSAEEKQNKLEQLTTLSTIFEKIVSHTNKIEKGKIKEFVDSTEEVLRPKASVANLLKKMLKHIKCIDFVGIAATDVNDQVVVRNFYCRTGNQTIVHKHFMLGEGFLGHALASEKTTFWKNIIDDPRTIFFTKHGFTPVSLFAVPLTLTNDQKCVIFGGSLFQEIDEEEIMDEIRFYTSLFQLIYSKNDILNKLNNHLIELSTIQEIMNTMLKMKDMKKIFYILLDMSINFSQSTAACIVFPAPEQSNRLTVLSRGMSGEFIKSYSKQISKSYFQDKYHSKSEPSLKKTEEGIYYEIPIRYEQEFYGILSIRISDEMNLEYFQPFLHSLVYACGISLYLLKHLKRKNKDEDYLEFHNEIVKKYAKNKYEMIVKTKDIAINFARYLNSDQETIDLIDKVVHMIDFDRDILKKFFSNQQWLEILDKYDELVKATGNVNLSETPITSRILYLANQYVQDKPYHALKKDKYLLKMFQQFISSLHYSEQEFPIPDHEEVDTNANIQNLLEGTNLSKREKEVLDLVLKGASNREIAETLYISDHTVKNHMTNILQKLGVNDRSQAIAKLYQMGYVPK